MSKSVLTPLALATRAWNFIPGLGLPIFQGGRLRTGPGVAPADRDVALAQYERPIRTGFREVADALASSAPSPGSTRSTRCTYAARSGLVAVQLAEQTNRVALYRVLGGGWRE